MKIVGSGYSFGRSRQLTAWQSFEAWRQFRRLQFNAVQERSQLFSTSFLRAYNQKLENASIAAAQAALDRINAASNVNATGNIKDQLTRLLDKSV